MEIHVNMKSFKENFQWNSGTAHYGNKIAECNGMFFTFDGKAYIRILTDSNVFFTAR